MSLGGVTIRGGFYSEEGNAYTSISGLMPRLHNIRRTVNRDGFRVATELLDSLIGATAGGAAAATHARVGAQFSSNPANVETPVVTVTDVNRNTTSADVAFLKSFLFNIRPRPAFPADASGNGGTALA
jgi:hypothetical protein